jgi:hypothetical protein
VSPPPPPIILRQPRRTLVGIGEVSAAAHADREDEKEDAVTDVYSERVTLVFNKEGIQQDESTGERPTLRRLPAPPSLPPPAVRAAARPSALPLPPPRVQGAAGMPPRPMTLPPPPPRSNGIPASLAAASLPPTGFAVALARENEARRRPLSALAVQALGLPVPSLRVGVALTAVAVVVLLAFSLGPAKGSILVSAVDSHGNPMNRLDVFMDGKKTPCDVAPCSVPCAKGLHEVRVVADGFEVPATQAVAVASGDSTGVQFIVGSWSEADLKVSGSQDAVTPAVVGNESAPPPQVPQDPVPASDSAMHAVTPGPEATATGASPPALAEQAAPPRDARPTSRPPAHPPSAPAAAKVSQASSLSALAVRPPAVHEQVGGGGAHGGYLNINSLPASSCYLDGTPLGSTPRLRVSVNAGSHTVKFRQPDGGSTKTIVVNVGAGETRLAVARL